MTKKVGFHTLGCKVNQYETDSLISSFRLAGYEISDFKEHCDVYIINTCTVTEEANRKSKQFIRQAKRKNPKSLVVAAGCFSQMEPDNHLADVVLGNKNKNEAVRVVDLFFQESTDEWKKEDYFLSDCDTQKPIYEETGSIHSREETRAIIKIEDGCNNFCSYCIIPYARGRVRSRNKDNILQEASDLAIAGFKEIVLTGIHLLAFTTDENKNTDAVLDIAEQVAGIKGIERIRLGSLEPESLTENFIDRLKENKKLCPHFHISLQSGSDRILERMNRKYTTHQFLNITEKICEKVQRASITTDIITGFPGESDTDHDYTVLFCERIGFLDMHIFKYSKRSGTKAAMMPKQITPSVISRRSSALIELAQHMRCNYFKKMLHGENRVLIEKCDLLYAYGYTENYCPVKIPVINEEMLYAIKGSIKRIEITGYNEDTLIGQWM
jgi:threonylcarbamoyladenosine tRNA methylthiotransferase MtaB